MTKEELTKKYEELEERISGISVEKQEIVNVFKKEMLECNHLFMVTDYGFYEEEYKFYCLRDCGCDNRHTYDHTVKNEAFKQILEEESPYRSEIDVFNSGSILVNRYDVDDQKIINKAKELIKEGYSSEEVLHIIYNYNPDNELVLQKDK